MGMYTELVLGVELKKNPPQDIVDLLVFMTSSVGIDTSIQAKADRQNHPFFRSSRWPALFWQGSYYFDGQPHRSFRLDDISGTWFLTTRSNLKNYEGEIQKFLDWIAPYVKSHGFSGYYRYEEDTEPILIYFNDLPEDETIPVTIHQFRR